MVVIQEEDKRIRMSGDFRVNIIKPIRFLEGTVKKETENTLKEVYKYESYMSKVEVDILKLKDMMKARFGSPVVNLPTSVSPKPLRFTPEKKISKQIKPRLKSKKNQVRF